jgi:hypothetical protein
MVVEVEVVEVVVVVLGVVAVDWFERQRRVEERRSICVPCFS